MSNRALKRWGSVAAGGLLAAAGIRKGGRRGMLLSALGGAVGVLGYMLPWRRRHNAFEAQNRHRWQLPRDRMLEDAKAFGRAGRSDGDVIHEASDESFPASDAPSFTPTTSIGKHQS